ncbi:MBOAT family O-acyltransferase, partial [Candidatus Auribacterota bacterium]
FLVYALYVSFFPQLVAGPIERSTRLLPQFYKKHDFNYDRVTDGVKLMLWGYFKKIVIADRLAIFVNNVYNNPHDLGGLPLIIATVFFGVQIYCDFSGYSDIAIGSAQVMGFNLMDNFKRPYFSKTITEFWRRWHISLSTWFKDYLYIPLGGNRCSKARNYFNIMVTFLISGIWHGANWTFIIWGALHGFYVVLEHIIKGAWEKCFGSAKFPIPSGVKKYLQVILTFTLVTFAWIFFRANSISDAFYIVGHLFTGLGSLLSYGAIKADLLGKGLGFGEYDLIIAIVSIAFMEYVHIIQRHESIRHMLRDKPIYIRWSIYYALVMWILLFGEYGTNTFIYYQF